MKYEYLKGGEKDFEGAPDWAMLVVENFAFKYNTWFYENDKEGGKWKQCKGQLHGFSGKDGIGHWLNIIAERRPITEPSWDGVGLPPVGCECEVKVGGDNYNLCRIVYSDSNAGVAFVYLGGDDEKYCGTIDCVTAGAAYGYSSQIRSEADKKRDAAIESLMRIVCGPSQASATVNKIYDAIASGKIPGVTLED